MIRLTAEDDTVRRVAQSLADRSKPDIVKTAPELEIEAKKKPQANESRSPSNSSGALPVAFLCYFASRAKFSLLPDGSSRLS